MEKSKTSPRSPSRIQLEISKFPTTIRQKTSPVLMPVNMERSTIPSPIAPIEDIVLIDPSSAIRKQNANQVKRHDMIPSVSLVSSSTSPTSINRPQNLITTAPPASTILSNDFQSHQFPLINEYATNTSIAGPISSTSNPQKPLLPMEFQYPLFREAQSSSLTNILKQKNVEITTSDSNKSFNEAMNNIPLDENDAIEREVLPIINGQSADFQIPSYYKPPLGKSSKARPILSSKEVNILLLHVSRLGDVHALRSLTRSPRLDVNMVDDEGRSPLMFASIGGHDECVDILIERGAIVHLADYSGRTALHWAAEFGRAEVVQKLLRTGAEVMADDYRGKTALHCAASSSNAMALLMLLKALKNLDDVNCLDDDNMTPMMWAAFYGNLQHVHLLLKHKANPMIKDVEGKTALHWTVGNKHIHCATILINNCKELITVRDRYGRIPLHLACGEGNIAIVYFMLVWDPTIASEKDELLRTSLHWAAICGKSAILKLLCEFGAKLNKKDKYGATPLFYSSQQNFQDCVHILLRKGASVSVQDEYGRQPLIWASIQGHIEVVKMLLQSRADVNAREDRGLSALHFAAYAGHTACCLYLIRNGADVNCVDYKQHSPLFRASISGHSETVLALISEGANVLAKDLAGRTALHWACSSGHIDVVNILVGYGAEIESRDAKGATPLHEASFHGKNDVMVYLLSRGANVNVCDDNGVTPLHWAAVNGHINCCRLLLSNGANVNAMVHDIDRDTPLDYAYLNNNFECVQLLIDQNGLMAEDILGKAATLIQKFWKIWGKKKGQRWVVGDPPKSKKAATVIQSIWRGYQQRKRYKKLLEESKLMGSETTLSLAIRKSALGPNTKPTPPPTGPPPNFTTTSSSTSARLVSTRSSADIPTTGQDFRARLSVSLITEISETPESPAPPKLYIPTMTTTNTSSTPK